MIKARNLFLIFSTISLLFSCANHQLTTTEAKIILSNIENNINNPTFNFPTKIAINKLYRKGESLTNRVNIRFSLNDYYYYYSEGLNSSKSTIKWVFAEESTKIVYYFVSKPSENDENKINLYCSKVNEAYSDYFKNIYNVLKDYINEAIETGNSKIDEYTNLANEYNFSETQSAKLDITSSDEYSIDLDANVSLKSLVLNYHLQYKNSLPIATTLYKKVNDIEDDNYETKYYYDSCNVTKPSNNDFIESPDAFKQIKRGCWKTYK